MTANDTATGATLNEEQLRSVLADYTSVTLRLQETHAALQREVKRLRQEVATKDRELERRRRLASLGELAAGVAHEIRNPLGAIQLYNTLLRKQIPRKPEVVGLVDKIDAGINAIDAIVTDTLALAPRSGELIERNVLDLLDEVSEACARVLTERGVTLAIECAQRELVIPAEPAALKRVFVNLITNAAQASEPDTRITISIAPVRDGRVVFRIIDQGPGLQHDVLEKLFDPFFTTKENGTGLGLTIAHRLIEAHSGRITARNAATGGAEFIIVLPGAKHSGSIVSPSSQRQHDHVA